MIPLAEYAAFLRRAAAEWPEKKLEVVKHHMEEAAKTAKGYYGKYQPGWSELAEATLEDKQAKGYDTPSPLLRDGTLRDSVSAETEALGVEIRGTVGSTDPVAVVQEWGSSYVPPRPSLVPALINELPKLEHAIGETLVRTLTPGH